MKMNSLQPNKIYMPIERIIGPYNFQRDGSPHYNMFTSRPLEGIYPFQQESDSPHYNRVSLRVSYRSKVGDDILIATIRAEGNIPGSYVHLNMTLNGQIFCEITSMSEDKGPIANLGSILKEHVKPKMKNKFGHAAGTFA